MKTRVNNIGFHIFNFLSFESFESRFTIHEEGAEFRILETRNFPGFRHIHCEAVNNYNKYAALRALPAQKNVHKGTFTLLYEKVIYIYNCSYRNCLRFSVLEKILYYGMYNIFMNIAF